MVGSFAGGFFYSAKFHKEVAAAPSDKDFNFSLLQEAVSKIDETYYENTSKKQLLNGAIAGMMDALKNPYASYYPPSDYKDFQTSLQGNYSGIGVVIGGKKGAIKALKIFEDSPAKKAGVKSGELIAKIDGKTTEKMDTEQAADLIKGPEGTTVKLTLKTGKKERVISIIRRTITFPNVTKKLYGKIGYINMHFFNGEASRELKKAILSLQKKGMKNLILDLRSNPGGQLNEAINVSSLFIDKGVIVRTKNKEKQETVYSATGNKIFSGKIIVLVSENTASASEIVSGAIQDRHRGIVLGVKTFGKGTVQQITQLSNDGALVIPSEKWLTPNGRDITKVGVKPDIILKLNSKTDNQLEKAKALLK